MELGELSGCPRALWVCDGILYEFLWGTNNANCSAEVQIALISILKVVYDEKFAIQLHANGQKYLDWKFPLTW